jgi:hypothetical protein
MTYPNFVLGDKWEPADANAVGLWLVKTVAVGAGVTSVPVTGAFSADYDSYKIVYSGGVGSGANPMSMRLGATAAGYYNQLIYAAYATATISANVADNNGAQWTFVGPSSTTMARVEIELNNPFQSLRTQIKGSYVDTTLSGNFAGFLNDTTSYTGFTLTVSGGGSVTGGTVRVYGYRN